MTEEFTFPILKGARFTLRKVRNKDSYRVRHLESDCCRGHAFTCKCGFCQLHKPYMETQAHKLLQIQDSIKE